jgi:hypothetical protein
MSIQKPQAGPIEVRQTPNPNARKFVLPGMRFVESRNYLLGEEVDDPLAARLLTLDGVYNVFLAQDFVTVNKVPQVDWSPLQAAVEIFLTEYLTQSATNNAG